MGSRSYRGLVGGGYIRSKISPCLKKAGYEIIWIERA